MPHYLHPRSRSTSSLFAATLLASFVIVGLPHIFPCPAPRRTLADSDMTMTDVDGRQMQRPRRKKRKAVDAPEQLSSTDGASRGLPQATDEEVSTFLQMEEEAETMARRATRGEGWRTTNRYPRSRRRKLREEETGAESGLWIIPSLDYKRCDLLVLLDAISFGDDYLLVLLINHNSSRMGNISVFEYNVTLTDFSVKGAVKIPPMLLAARDVTEPPQLEVAYKARHILVLAYNYNQA
ncbi:hypothetical protein T310_0675 [Rasamsonia emersonii CBS 393.64]|uniref:Uncharacterized protein n=1 Tax=Rasamsonia emersonii (strain ATCC 16479 / CBS 393.64 / IMI 116815) TaxID=1408163 RepID=A0A0F4Z5E0_RASE3|nr:hypothetical protein T310_0675 [Rasamsonia emersonii CBS 393.64]KKA25301.1 hypothetical protein T310_0675 [Rasamsonia emersonii CBS 393.64]